ncbi:hypothetical protein F444_20506 [Phytophthora nicotianae P1976]|uniref:Uncharacterized protein n=1 Tax=Phytophthora nicotianae P1976 TaxID=1317066 RepID=A0A080Z4C0_PHYNI|nr:hypothetical protein F444_20506 [Phytophthora nicotianae P1976]
MLRAAQVMPMTCGSIPAALDKQLPALEMLARSAQLTVSPVEKPACIDSSSEHVIQLQQLEDTQPDQQTLQTHVKPRRSSRVRRLTKINTPAFSARSSRPSRRKKICKALQSAPTWRVAYIKDRVTTARGEKLYRVLWRTKKYGRLPRTWEPHKMLSEDGFGDMLAIVDEWVDAGRKEDFFQFVSQKYPSVAGANPTGTCLFLALQQALVLVGDVEGVKDAHIQHFLERSEELLQDLSRGLPWRIFRAFISQVHLNGSRLSLVDIDDNKHRTGHRGIAAFERLNLEDGFYLVAASNTMAVGHAFVLQVVDARMTVYDDNIKRSLRSYGEWIDRLMFVRKVVLQN